MILAENSNTVGSVSILVGAAVQDVEDVCSTYWSGHFYISTNTRVSNNNINMVLTPALFGLMGSLSGFIALVANFKIDPFYSAIVKIDLRLGKLQRAREVVVNRRSVKIKNEQETLETLHQVAAEEYEHISDRYTPVEFSWFYQGFRFRYAEQRKQGKKNRPNVQDEFLEFIDNRIENRLGRIAAIFSIFAIVGFLLLIVTSL